MIYCACAPLRCPRVYLSSATAPSSPAPPRTLRLQSIMSAVDLNGTYTALLAAQSAIAHLPDVPATVAMLAGMEGTAPLLLANASALQADVDDFAAARAALLPGASQLRGNLTAFTAGRPRLRAAAVWVRGNASDVTSFQATLCAASNPGSALAVQADLATAARSPAGGLPTVAALQLATGADGGTGGTLDQLVRHRPDIDGNDARIGALVANLQALRAPLASLPNFATTAARLSAIAASISAFGGSSRTLAKLSSSMDAAVALSAAVPAPSTLSEQLSGVSGALAAFNLPALRGHLIDLNATLVVSAACATALRVEAGHGRRSHCRGLLSLDRFPSPPDPLSLRICRRYRRWRPSSRN